MTEEDEMLVLVGLEVLVLVGERIRKMQRKDALVRSVPEGQLREAFERAERAWRRKQRRAA